MAAFVLLNAPSGAPPSSRLALNAELLADNGAPYFIAGPTLRVMRGPGSHDPGDLTADLVDIVGVANVLTKPDERASYETDWTGRWHGTASCVVRPGSPKEVSDVVARCAKARVAIVPQGGNTGLAGGGVPRSGEIVLSTLRLDDVGPADPVTASIVCGAGATLAAIRESACRCGMDVGLDLASRDSATIGGMVATNAGGHHVMRYGPMRDHVIAAEAVRADGAIIGSVPGLRQNNTGYNLAGLLCGSEGTLAIITRVQVGLISSPRERAVATLAFRNTAGAVAAMTRLRPGVPSLSALELFGSNAVDLVAHRQNITPLFGPLLGQAHCAFLLVEIEGSVGCTEELLGCLVELEPFVLASAIATDESGMRRLWQWRDSIPDAIAAAGTPHKLDIAVPLASIPSFESELSERLARSFPKASAIMFGHAGCGNLHVNVLGVPPEDESVDDLVLCLAAEFGGTISAEHGIGVAKTRWLSLSRSHAEIVTMRQIKKALDPSGILNPGVIFGPP